MARPERTDWQVQQDLFMDVRLDQTSRAKTQATLPLYLARLVFTRGVECVVTQTRISNTVSSARVNFFFHYWKHKVCISVWEALFTVFTSWTFTCIDKNADARLPPDWSARTHAHKNAAYARFHDHVEMSRNLNLAYRNTHFHSSPKACVSTICRNTSSLLYTCSNDVFIKATKLIVYHGHLIVIK